MEQNQTQKRFLVGFIILIAGVAILLGNLDILDGRLGEYLYRYLLRWELIMVSIGIVILISHDNKGPGIAMLVIGGVLYLKHTHGIHFPFNFWQVFWPAMLILAGILIIFKKKFNPHCEKKNMSDDDIIDEISIFGGSEKTIVTQNFKGGKILAVFGGSTFNLTRARLAPGKNYIEVMAVFGGMKMIVPDDWNVKIDIIAIFGGFVDKHRIRIQEPGATQESELILKGFVLFGGGEIKSF